MKPFFLFLLIILLPANCIANDRIIFCNVNQGDAALIRLKTNIDILIDAGPDDSVLRCLKRNMAPFDRTIELLILSHADSDHYAGLSRVLKHYTVKQFLEPALDNKDHQYVSLVNVLKKQKAAFLRPESGDTFFIAGAEFKFLFPDKSAIQSCLPNDRNECSHIFNFTLRNFSVLFTGDSTPEILHSFKPETIPATEVLKVPHHGSKTGLTEGFLKKVNPLVSIISSGENNRYGHPHAQILTMLENYNYLRTDQKGTVIIHVP